MACYSQEEGGGGEDGKRRKCSFRNCALGCGGFFSHFSLSIFCAFGVALCYARWGRKQEGRRGGRAQTDTCCVVVAFAVCNAEKKRSHFHSEKRNATSPFKNKGRRFEEVRPDVILFVESVVTFVVTREIFPLYTPPIILCRKSFLSVCVCMCVGKRRKESGERGEYIHQIHSRTLRRDVKELPEERRRRRKTRRERERGGGGGEKPSPPLPWQRKKGGGRGRKSFE